MNSRVTLIEQLPDINDLEQDYDMLPRQERERVHKYIRNNGYNVPNESGMQLQYQNEQQPLSDYQQQLPPQYMLQQQAQEPQQAISCADVYKHIENCPICGKLYSNDKTLYIVAIIFLAVVCIILLKKVLDV